MEPIGHVRARSRYRYDAPRQGVLAGETGDTIVLAPGQNFEQALTGLDGFERIWVLWAFHLNKGWKPVAHPPRAPAAGVGVFASRAPYRPNPLGLSAVRLVSVSGRELVIAESDLLDGTPVLDIKPYLPYADAFPGAAAGWTDGLIEKKWTIEFGAAAEARCQWIEAHAGLPVREFIVRQMECDPLDRKRRRIARIDGPNWVLSYRTWRVDLVIDEECRRIGVVTLRSGYSREELRDAASDRWQDKAVHVKFIKAFGPN